MTYAAWVYFLARHDERLAALPPVRAYCGALSVVMRYAVARSTELWD